MILLTVRLFSACIMKLDNSSLGHARKLKFSSYVHLPSMNQIFQYHHARLILCNVEEVYIFEDGLYISARMLIFSNYVLLASVNTVYIYILSCLCGLLM